jgi:O-antigen/teichoic acid export membrane protein
VERSAVRDISRGSFFLGLEQVTQFIFGTLYFMAILRLLSLSLYGILSLGLAVSGLAGIATLNLENYLERFVPELHATGRSKALRALFKKILIVKASTGFVVSLVVVLLTGLLANAYNKPELRQVLPAIGWMVLLEASFITFRSFLFGLQRFKAIWIIALVVNVSKMVMVGLVALLHGGLAELAWGLIIVVGITTTLAGIIVWRVLNSLESTGEDDAPSFRQIWEYVLPLLGARSFYVAGQHLNKVILGALLGSRELGLIAFTLNATERFVGVLHPLSLALLPSMSRLKGLKELGNIERILNGGFRVVSVAALIASVGLVAFGREIIIVMGGFKYLQALPAFQILSLVYLFRTVEQPLTMTFFTFEKTKVVFWLAGLKLVAELACYPVLIPLMGITGVALAVVISSVVKFGPSMGAVGRIFPESQHSRLGGILRIWGLAAVLLGAIVVTQSFVPLVWPSLIVRLNIVILGLPVAIILSRLIRSDDLARLRDEIKGPLPQKLLSMVQSVLVRAEGALGV